MLVIFRFHHNSIIDKTGVRLMMRSRLSVHQIPICASDGVNLTLHRICPPSLKKSFPVVLVPGMFCDQAFFLQRGRGLAHYLAEEHGFDVFVLQRRTRGLFADIVARDVPAGLAGALAASGAPRAVLAGHSAGAGAALCAALSSDEEAREQRIRHRLAGLALLSVPHPATGGLARRAGILIGLGLTKTLGRFPAKQLRMSNMDEAETIFNPWLMWHWNRKFGTYLDQPTRLHVPVFSAVGKQDYLWAPVRGSKLLHDLVEDGSEKSKFCVFPGGHGDLVTDIPRAKERLW